MNLESILNKLDEEDLEKIRKGEGTLASISDAQVFFAGVLLTAIIELSDRSLADMCILIALLQHTAVESCRQDMGEETAAEFQFGIDRVNNQITKLCKRSEGFKEAIADVHHYVRGTHGGGVADLLSEGVAQELMERVKNTKEAKDNLSAQGEGGGESVH